MELISTFSSEYGDGSWDSETLTKANSFHHQLTSFEFLVTICITMSVFSNLRYLTINLKKRTTGVGTVENKLWIRIPCLEIKALADSINILVIIPRIASIQVHRAKVPPGSPEVCCHKKHLAAIPRVT